jgi:uncharacterized membrane protein
MPVAYVLLGSSVVLKCVSLCFFISVSVVAYNNSFYVLSGSYIASCLCSVNVVAYNLFCVSLFLSGREEKRWYSQLKTVRPKTQGASVLSYQRRLGGFSICKTIIVSCICGGTYKYLCLVFVVEPTSICAL